MSSPLDPEVIQDSNQSAKNESHTVTPPFSWQLAREQNRGRDR